MQRKVYDIRDSQAKEGGKLGNRLCVANKAKEEKKGAEGGVKMEWGERDTE